MVVAHPERADRLRPIAEQRGLRFLLTTDLLAGGAGEAVLPALTPDRRAMILYTSGTTSRPKGVVSTHGNVQAQVTTLVEAWGWQPADHILLVLPLHHTHGIINVVTCALWSGAQVTIHPKFDAEVAWEAIAGGALTLFMAVPTIYSRLIAAWEAAPMERQAALSAGCRKLRLMVSGSAALPVRVLEQWQEISGHVLLERYGMTEIGMALSNPLRGRRRPGFVGVPLPGVAVRLVDEQGREVPPARPARLRWRARRSSGSTGAGPRRRRRPSGTAGSAPATSPWWRRATTGSSGGAASTSSRRAGTKSPPWRLRRRCGSTRRSGRWRWWVFPTRSGASSLAPHWCWRWGGAHAGGAAPLGRRSAGTVKLPTRLLALKELPRNAMGKVTKPDLVRLFSGFPS